MIWVIYSPKDNSGLECLRGYFLQCYIYLICQIYETCLLSADSCLPPALANGQSNGDYPLFCRFLQWCRKLLLVTQAPSQSGWQRIHGLGLFIVTPDILWQVDMMCVTLSSNRDVLVETFKMSNWLDTFHQF